jgi:hypothetical protein
MKKMYRKINKRVKDKIKGRNKLLNKAKKNKKIINNTNIKIIHQLKLNKNSRNN